MSTLVVGLSCFWLGFALAVFASYCVIGAMPCHHCGQNSCGLTPPNQPKDT